MRNAKREIKDFDRIISIIDNCKIIHIGMVDNGEAYIVPLNFGYNVDENKKITFYFHSAKEGRKIDLLKASASITFEMENAIQFVESEKPCEWTIRFESVMGKAKASLLTDLSEKDEALEKVMIKCGFQGKPEFPETALKNTAVWKLEVTELSAKSNI